MVGIYKITNTINGKCYIGQSTNLANRIRKHINTLRNGTNRNKHLQNAYNKYGPGTFTIEIIEECDKEELNEREIFWIDFYNLCDKEFGYNKTKGGTGGNGYLEVCDDDTRAKIKQKQSESKKGELNPIYHMHCYTDGITIKYISDTEIDEYESKGWRKGVPDFVREKESIANTGSKNGFYGKQHSDESKQKMSESKRRDKNGNFGKVLYSKDNEQKYIGLNEVEYYESLGWTRGSTEEFKTKVSQANTGRKVPDEMLRKKSNIYWYDNNEYIGWRKLQLHLKENGYPKISEVTIVKLANGGKVKGYEDLVGKIILISSNKKEEV